MKIQELVGLAARLREEMAKAIVGQRETVELMLTALLCGGHVLLEGPPGTAKTFMVQCLARALSLEFGRIQFTPDLMPGDILGANIYDFRSGAFALTRGPVFCELLLADEINRAPPKTQAALLEAMQERQVTLDGKAQPLSARFTVIATQNPIEQQGVYPLPEAQLDRFLFKQTLPYPSAEEERAIVARHGLKSGSPDPVAMGVAPVAGADDLAEAADAISQVRLADELADYVTALIRATRESAELESGASPRAAAMLALAARTRAALEGRDYAVPDDAKALVLPALRHRVILSPAAEIEGRRVDEVLRGLVERVEAPR
ncbi:MAG TPA: MoxR family ATPase [Caulobacteraceae bacterium]|nr:MoxR family ATPase [Caulobacteraceae bacterium]